MTSIKILPYSLKVYYEIRSLVLLAMVQLQNLSHMGEELVKMTQSQLFYLF